MKDAFAKLTSYKNNIAMKILMNDNIIKALSNNNSDFLADPLPSPEDIFLLFYDNIFPYKHVPEINDDVSTFITMEFDRHRYINNSFKSGHVTFYVFTHKSIVRTDYGLRYDYLLNEINNLFNKELGVAGVFKLNLIGAGDFQANENYYGATVTYEFTDFH